MTGSLTFHVGRGFLRAYSTPSVAYRSNPLTTPMSIRDEPFGEFIWLHGAKIYSNATTAPMVSEPWHTPDILRTSSPIPNVLVPWNMLCFIKRSGDGCRGSMSRTQSFLGHQRNFYRFSNESSGLGASINDNVVNISLK
jgi:hypothetical protein